MTREDDRAGSRPERLVRPVLWTALGAMLFFYLLVFVTIFQINSYARNVETRRADDLVARFHMMSPPALANLFRDLGYEGVAVVSSTLPAPPGAVMISLAPLKGSPKTRLAFMPLRPAMTTYLSTLPYKFPFVLCILAAIILLVRRVGRQTRLIDEHRQREQQRALTDSLTGLPNRRQFEARLSAALAERGENAVGLALFIVDLDAFKQVNDSHGHAVGDELLRQVAARLRTHLEPEQFVARLSGDEFALLLRWIGTPLEALDLGGRLARDLARPHDLPQGRIAGGASIGVAWHDGRADVSEADLLHTADMALYEAKRQGRGRAVVRQPDTQQKAIGETARRYRKAAKATGRLKVV